MDKSLDEIIIECSDEYLSGGSNLLLLAELIICATLAIFYVTKKYILPYFGDNVVTGFMVFGLAGIGALTSMGILWLINFYIICKQNR